MQSDFRKKVKAAQKRVAGMDKIDGWKDRLLPTILSAFNAGLQGGNEWCLFDAYVMLGDLCRPGQREKMEESREKMHKHFTA